MYKCPNCGGEIEFLPANGKIKCEYCGSEFSPEEAIDKARKNAVEHEEEGGGKVYTCSQCGASIYTTEDTGVTFCSYCGSQAFLKSRVYGKEDVAPDVLIPFAISKEDCESIYKKKIKSAWFLPKEMRADNTIDKFRGIYMPCWIYDGEVWADANYESTTKKYEGAFDVIETYQVNVASHGSYDGYVEDASASFPDTIMREIAPFDMKQAKPFNDKYMAGFYADIGNTPSDVYESEFCSFMDAGIKNDIADSTVAQAKGLSVGTIGSKTSIKTKITDVKKGYLPVWFLSNKNKTNGMMSYAVVNGLTGKIHADLPVDMKKYLLCALIIAIPIFVILQFFTMKPETLLIVTMILLGIMMFFSTGMIREAYIAEHGLDDTGLQYLLHKQNGNLTGNNKGTVSSTASDKTSKKILGRLGVGALCFILIPLLSIAASWVLQTNLLLHGFIFGIMVFIAAACCRKEKKTSKGTEHFKPQKETHRLPFLLMLRAIALPLIGILIGGFLLIATPAHDLYYYGAAIVCCIMLILTVLDFVRKNNRLSLRKPAQLGKRGGDEDED